MEVASTVYFCEEVSSIKEVDGLFYLTDKCGGVEITRVMRPATFARCVAGASEVLAKWRVANLDRVAPIR